MLPLASFVMCVYGESLDVYILSLHSNGHKEWLKPLTFLINKITLRVRERERLSYSC
jgi:hypothetical protein